MKEYFESKFNFEKNYNEINKFHRSRRMFAIKDKKLYLADINTGESHTDWFLRANWISVTDDSEINRIIRGFVDNRGIFFYVGYDFITTQEIEKEFLMFLQQLVLELRISDDTHVYAGCVVQKESPFPPKKDLGTVRSLIY